MRFFVEVRRTHVPFQKKFRPSDPFLYLEKEFNNYDAAYEYFERGWSRELLTEGSFGRYEVSLKMGRKKDTHDSGNYCITSVEVLSRWLKVQEV